MQRERHFGSYRTAQIESDDLCESCDVIGLFEKQVCNDCLGQGVLLYEEEYDALLKLSGHSADVLDSEIIE